MDINIQTAIEYFKNLRGRIKHPRAGQYGKALAIELEDLLHTFDMVHKAHMRGIKMWQDETGREMVWPGTDHMVKWLLDKTPHAELELAMWEANFGRSNQVVTVEYVESLESLILSMIHSADGWDTDKDVNGADLVDFVGEWRNRARSALDNKPKRDVTE